MASISTLRDPTWGNFTFLFKTRKPNPISPPDPLVTNPVATERRRKIEQLHEQRKLHKQLQEVWE